VREKRVLGPDVTRDLALERDRFGSVRTGENAA